MLILYEQGQKEPNIDFKTFCRNNSSAMWQNMRWMLRQKNYAHMQESPDPLKALSDHMVAMYKRVLKGDE
jgi:hypothetical protein